MRSLSLVMSECSLSGRGQGHVSNFCIVELENFATASRRYTGIEVFSALLLGNWQDFNWHDASRGPSAIAELLVIVWSISTNRPSFAAANQVGRWRTWPVNASCNWVDLLQVGSVYFCAVKKRQVCKQRNEGRVKNSRRLFITSQSVYIRATDWATEWFGHRQ